MLPNLRSSLLTTFLLDPYYKTLDTEQMKPPAEAYPQCSVCVRVCIVSKASRPQGSKLNPSIVQK